MPLTVNGNITITGASGNLCTLTNVAITVDGGDTYTADYATVTSCPVTGGTITATNSTDNGGNTNWDFGGGAYTLTAAAGTYAGTGQATGLLANRLLTAASGTYAGTGQAAGLTYPL